MGVLRKLFFPFSVLYSSVVYLRNRLYDWGIFRSKTYQTPVICIGNLSVGGTGKTPMVELLINLLHQKYKVAVLSRGYKRSSKGYVLATENTKVHDLGDEPYQIFSKFNQVIVAVDTDRQNGIERLEIDFKPDVILLDDAFQHRKVKPLMAILLTSFHRLYHTDWCLPTGHLRDNRKEARRAAMIIVTKMPPNCTKTQRLEIKQSLKINSDQKVIFSYLKYNKLLQGKGPLKSIDDLKDKKISLVTGIADASPLLLYLNENKISYEHLNFKDHHNFTAEDFKLLKSKANLLTTEKDYMRLKDNVDACNYISITHAFFDDGLEQLESELATAIKTNVQFFC